MYKFNSKVLYLWSKNFLKKWDDSFARIAGGEEYRTILKDITKELLDEDDRKRKSTDMKIRKSIMKEQMPCLCRPKKQRGSGKKRKRRTKRKKRRKKYRRKTRKKKTRK